MIFSILSTKFAYTLLHIKAVGEEVAVGYDFAGWDVVDELDVV